MSGCYRCGLPDGSEERLCETCFARRFQCGKLSLEPYAATQATGIEISPRVQRWLLSGGAVLYISVLSLGIVIQGERVELRQARIESEYVRAGANDYPVIHQHDFGYIGGPRVAFEKD